VIGKVVRLFRLIPLYTLVGDLSIFAHRIVADHFVHRCAFSLEKNIQGGSCLAGILEICVDSLASAWAAIAGGADGWIRQSLSWTNASVSDAGNKLV
jgi:hypothetical protein